MYASICARGCHPVTDHPIGERAARVGVTETILLARLRVFYFSSRNKKKKKLGLVRLWSLARPYKRHQSWYGFRVEKLGVYEIACRAMMASSILV